jgi:hypothetical protein
MVKILSQLIFFYNGLFYSFGILLIYLRDFASGKVEWSKTYSIW